MCVTSGTDQPEERQVNGDLENTSTSSNDDHSTMEK